MNQNELKELYANNLKAVKKALHLTTGELAAKLDIPVRTVGSYERKENLCSAQLITELCRKLDINANWFAAGEGNMFKTQLESVSDSVFEQKTVKILKKYGIM